MTRGRAGLWSVATLAAAIVPVFTQVAVLHRTQWPVPAGPFWPTVVVPWSARVWTVLMLVALAGWTASAAPPDPRVPRRLLGGATRAALGVSVAAVATIPGFVWLARLGAAPLPVLAGVYGAALLIVLAGALVAGLGGALLPVAPAAGLGGAAGLALAWALG